jgi:hypothetical protein
LTAACGAGSYIPSPDEYLPEFIVTGAGPAPPPDPNIATIMHLNMATRLGREFRQVKTPMELLEIHFHGKFKEALRPPFPLCCVEAAINPRTPSHALPGGNRAVESETLPGRERPRWAALPRLR